MPYALQPMLKIRVMREDKAQTALTAAKRVRVEAERALDARREDLREYERTRDDRRDAIFGAVMGRVVSMESLEVMQEGVARIDEEGVLLRDNVSRAQDEVAEKTRLENDAHASYRQASKNKMKIEEHRAIWEAEDLKDREYRAELELEDFTGRKKTDDDDDTFD